MTLELRNITSRHVYTEICVLPVSQNSTIPMAVIAGHSVAVNDLNIGIKDRLMLILSVCFQYSQSTSIYVYV